MDNFFLHILYNISICWKAECTNETLAIIYAYKNRFNNRSFYRLFATMPRTNVRAALTLKDFSEMQQTIQDIKDNKTWVKLKTY